MPVLKILQSGETNINSTDIFRFAFHSGYPTFKIGSVGSANFTITTGNDSAETTVTHNLGYEPIYFASVLKGTKSYQVPAWTSTDIEVPIQEGGNGAVAFYSIIDNANQIKIGAFLPYGHVASNQTFTASWIITLDEF